MSIQWQVTLETDRGYKLQKKGETNTSTTGEREGTDEYEEERKSRPHTE